MFKRKKSPVNRPNFRFVFVSDSDKSLTVQIVAPCVTDAWAEMRTRYGSAARGFFLGSSHEIPTGDDW